MMKNLRKKMGLALAMVFAVGCVAWATYNAYVVTRFNDVSVLNLLIRDTGIYDANAALRLTLGATNAITGNLTVSGTLAPTGAVTLSTATVSGSMGFRLSNPCAVTTTTPTALGQIVIDSSYTLYIATQTATCNWQKIGTQS